MEAPSSTVLLTQIMLDTSLDAGQVARNDLPVPIGMRASEWASRLEKWRPYLLRIAIDELDSQLRPKIAPSDVVQMTLLQLAGSH